MANPDPPPPDPPPVPENLSGLKPILAATPENLTKVLEDRPVLWVGAGASMAAGYPSTGKLIEAMVKAADDPIDPKLPFFEIADKFVESVGEGTLQILLQREIGPPRDPAPFHRAIARLAAAGRFAAVITTNYDDLLERALSDAGVRYVLQPLEGNAPVEVDGHLRLLKLHGSRDDWEKIVLSKHSYDEFRGRYPFLNAQLDVLLRQRPVLFVGCSLQDPRILNWLADLPPKTERNLKRWRALMTAPDWKSATEYKWERGHASGVLSRGNIRPLILDNYKPHLESLLFEVVQDLAPPAAQRLDIEIQVQPGGPWTARLEGLDWHPADLFQDARWNGLLEQLRDLSVRALPTDERGHLSPEAASATAALRSLAVEVGRRMTEGLLSPEARERLAAAARAGRPGSPPFVVIQVRPVVSGAEAEHLADRVLALPWELLWIEDRFPIEDGTLDLAREAVVPNLPELKEPDKPLAVVATIAAPTDSTDFDYEEEMFRLWRAVGEEGQEKRLLVTDLGTLEEFAKAIEQHEPPVIHFSGHGRPGLLLFEDEAALSDPVKVDELARRLRDSGTLPRLIYLSACHGATAGVVSSREGSGQRMVDHASTSETVPSTAATLHRAGFPQVVAYFGPVGDRQATRAAAAFYSCLAAGEPARQALRSARRVSAEALRDGSGFTHLYPLGWAQLALYHRGPDWPTALTSATGTGIDLPEEERKRWFDPLSKTGRTERVEGIQGVQRLRFGFVGRRGPRAEALARWNGGNRRLVVFGLGGLGKTALCAELAPLLAARLKPGGARILAFDGRYARAQPDPVFALWQEVQAARSDDAEWLQILAGLQEKGVTVDALTGAIAKLAALEGGLLVYLDDTESLLKPPGSGEIGTWLSPELRRLWDFLIEHATRPGFGLLASSRYVPEGTPEEAKLPLAPMSRYEIIRLFAWEPTLQRIPAADRAWLAERIDGHPRTVEYLEVLARNRELKISPPGKRYQGQHWREDILNPVLGPVEEKIAADLLLGRVWEALGSEAQEHLGICSVLDAPVPWEAIQVVSPSEQTARELAEAGLLSPFQPPSGPEAWWAPHRLVSEEVRQRWAGDPKTAHQIFGGWFREQLETTETFDSELARRAVDHLLKAGEADLAWPTARLIVIGLRTAGRYREGLVWIERILEAGPTGAQRGLALTFQAQLLGLAGIAKKATKTALKEALNLVEQENRAFVLTELGGLCQRLADLPGAASYFEQAVKVSIEVKGEMALDVAGCLHQLAGVLKTQGDLHGARERLERSLQIQDAVFGTEEHPDVATSLRSLASVLQAQGDLDSARGRLEQSLQIYAAVFGTEEHPDVAASLHELARVLQAKGDLNGARERLERSLQIQDAVFGTEEHPDAAASLHELARVLQAQGDLNGAREKLERVLEIEVRVYGTRDHYSTAMTEYALASLLWEEGEQQRAVELWAHAYTVFLQQLGPEHPYTQQLVALFAKPEQEPEAET